MLTRTLTTLTLLLALTGGTQPAGPGIADLNQTRAARRTRPVEDIGGCREPAPAAVVVAPAACTDGGQP